MPADLFYASEKFGLSVSSMAKGWGDLRARLADAYINHACFAVPPEGGSGPVVEQGLKDRIMAFAAAITADNSTSPSDVLARLSNEDVDDLAAELLEIEYELRTSKEQYMEDLRER